MGEAGIGWIWATDAEGRLIYLSETASEKLGKPVDELLAQPLVALFETDPDNPDERSDRPLNFQLSARSKIHDLTVRVVTDQARDAEPLDLVVDLGPSEVRQGRQVPRLSRQRQGRDGRIRAQARWTRAWPSTIRSPASPTATAWAAGSTAILSAYKSAKRICALMMLDLDRFKYVNDTMGHPAGDDLLRQVAERLRNIIGDRGEIGRLGGDEFQVILPDIDDRGKLGELADKVIQIISPALSDRRQAGDHRHQRRHRHRALRRASSATRSSALPTSRSTPPRTAGAASSASIRPTCKDEEEERRLLLEDLREALAADQLQLHYQPVVRTKDHVVVGFEALMRWEHPERGYGLARRSSSRRPRNPTSSTSSASGRCAAPATMRRPGPRPFASRSTSRPCSSTTPASSAW